MVTRFKQFYRTYKRQWREVPKWDRPVYTGFRDVVWVLTGRF